MANLVKQFEALIALPQMVGVTLLDEVQDNSAELQGKFSSPGISVQSIAESQQIGSVRQRTRVTGDADAKVESVAKQILDDTEAVAQQIVTSLKMFMGLKASVQ